MKKIIDEKNWGVVTDEMHEKGFSIIGDLLTDEQCEKLKTNYSNPHLYRKTVVMERYHIS